MSGSKNKYVGIAVFVSTTISAVAALFSRKSTVSILKERKKSVYFGQNHKSHQQERRETKPDRNNLDRAEEERMVRKYDGHHRDITPSIKPSSRALMWNLKKHETAFAGGITNAPFKALAKFFSDCPNN